MNPDVSLSLSSMDALSIAHAVGTLLSSVALGGMLFFAAVFAPAVFRTLQPATAADFLRQVFPVYYRVLTALTILAALLLWDRWEALVLAMIALLFVFARYGLMPRISQARDARLDGDESEGRTFVRLHRLSVVINLSQMAALLAVCLRLLLK
jgi:Domain of unknown function (DUF4149)